VEHGRRCVADRRQFVADLRQFVRVGAILWSTGVGSWSTGVGSGFPGAALAGGMYVPVQQTRGVADAVRRLRGAALRPRRLIRGDETGIPVWTFVAWFVGSRPV